MRRKKDIDTLVLNNKVEDCRRNKGPGSGAMSVTGPDAPCCPAKAAVSAS